ncbi:hypothetical protein B296_00020305 [Ensete ventricosum]|uniref:Uncharacterized protein n=1 Tax=Ensete ventricosum TaxID=4639 RepID=A0A426Y2I9_ENSVE|nr:hypothetical protein B296_00020305 [Ensete ventricosum]
MHGPNRSLDVDLTAKMKLPLCPSFFPSLQTIRVYHTTVPRGVVGRGQGGLRCHLGLPYETQGNRGEQFFLVDMRSIWQEEELIDTIEANDRTISALLELYRCMCMSCVCLHPLNEGEAKGAKECVGLKKVHGEAVSQSLFARGLFLVFFCRLCPYVSTSPFPI